MQERIDKHDEILSDLRVTVARLDERTLTIIEKLDQAVIARRDLEERLEPLAESVTRWKGGLTVIALAAGAIGAAAAKVATKLLSEP
jgi:hypothetical protein